MEAGKLAHVARAVALTAAAPRALDPGILAGSKSLHHSLTGTNTYHTQSTNKPPNRL